MKMKKSVMRGFHYISKGAIRGASEIFDEQYFLNPQDLDVQFGRVFCDIATQNFGKGVGMGDYYFMRRREKKAEELSEEIEMMIKKVSEVENQEVKEALGFALAQAESLECATLEDFKRYVATRENFKEAFEDFNLSTKIVFFNKDELCEFLDILVENNLPTLALQYAELIGTSKEFDPRIYNILQRGIKQNNESE